MMGDAFTCEIKRIDLVQKGLRMARDLIVLTEGSIEKLKELKEEELMLGRVLIVQPRGVVDKSND